jgi:hypothetical protein
MSKKHSWLGPLAVAAQTLVSRIICFWLRGFLWKKIIGLQHLQKYNHAKLKVFSPEYTRCQENILTNLMSRSLNFFKPRCKKYHVPYVQYTTDCGLHCHLKALQHVFTEEPFGKKWHQPTVDELSPNVLKIYYIKKW